VVVAHHGRWLGLLEMLSSTARLGSRVEPQEGSLRALQHEVKSSTALEETSIYP